MSNPLTELGIAIVAVMVTMLALGFGLGFGLGQQAWPDPVATCGHDAALVIYDTNHYGCNPL